MAENDGKIYITISNKKGGSDTPTPENGTPKKDSDNVLKGYIEHQFFHLISREVTKVVNYGINNIGNFTANYQLQRDIQNTKNAIQPLVNLGTAFAAGTVVTGSPIGGIVTAGIAAVGMISSTVLEQVSIQRQIDGQNFSISVLRERSGLNVLLDGSRGTEN